MGISTLELLEIVKNKLSEQDIIFNYTDLRKIDEQAVIKNIIEQRCGTHADEVEMSMMLYIKPSVVKMEKAIDADLISLDEIKPGPLTQDKNSNKGIYSPSGAWGNPLLATAQKGEVIVKEYLKYLQKEIKGGLLHQVYY